MSDELKPCPFCGSGRVAGFTSTCDSRLFREYVACEDCGASTTTHETKAGAVSAWNARAERTCEMLRMPTGEKAAYSDTDEVIWHCRFCHAERSVYAFGDDGDVWAAAPKFCPECGAKAVKPPELTCGMNRVLLYDKEGVEGIECDECGWEDIHDWDDPLPERCPGCKAEVVG